MKKNTILKKVHIYLFYIFIAIFFIGFNFQDSPNSNGWYIQNLQDLNGQQVSDLIFVDSLSGFIITSNSNPNDTGYILKSTNGGDNWNIVYRDFMDFSRIKFLNKDTGFVSGGFGTGARLLKTTNAGINWFYLNIPGGGLINLYDLWIFGNDTIWVTETNGLVGGIYRTTDGGANWQRLTNGITQPYPDKIYFYNSRIGFASSGSRLFKTTDSGFNWALMGTNTGFFDMKFKDSLTGYKGYDTLKKTTDGGSNWQTQLLPRIIGANYTINWINRLSLIGKDTIWCVGGYYTIPGYSEWKATIYKTTNGGQNWGYQLPDTSLGLKKFDYVFFYNKRNGWVYNKSNRGLHTMVGGNDSTIYTNIKEQITNVSSFYELKQNYPNPFNSKTVIGYLLLKNGNIKLIVYNILGKEIANLVNENKKEGKYEVKFDGNSYSSGIYFYTLFVDNQRIDTKKLLLLK